MYFKRPRKLIILGPKWARVFFCSDDPNCFGLASWLADWRSRNSILGEHKARFYWQPIQRSSCFRDWLQVQFKFLFLSLNFLFASTDWSKYRNTLMENYDYTALEESFERFLYICIGYARFCGKIQFQFGVFDSQFFWLLLLWIKHELFRKWLDMFSSIIPNFSRTIILATKSCFACASSGNLLSSIRS